MCGLARLSTLLVLLLVLLTMMGLGRSSPLQQSILFLQCDEMDGRVLDPSHPLSKITYMPYLTSLAKNGVNFVNAYTNNPLCAPSRASMFAGRYSSSIRAFSNVKSITTWVDDVSKADPSCAKLVGYGEEWCVEQGRKANISGTINTLMRQAGYNVTLYGKMDTGGGPVMNPPGTEAAGYHDSGVWSNKTPHTYYPGDVLHSWAKSANISRAAFVPLDAPGNLWIDGDRPSGGPFPQDWVVVRNCVDFLSKWQPSDGPFFLYCSIVNPHPPYYSNSTWTSHVNQTALNASIAAMPWPAMEAMHPADVYSTVTEGVVSERDDELIYRLARAYHGQTAEADYMMGQILKALDASGASNSTNVFFTSDHGEMHMEHRLVEKMSMYEGSARVPMIARGPLVDASRAGSVERLPVSLVDLLPTFLEIAGAEEMAGLDGQSLVPLLQQWQDASRRDFVVSEYLGDEANTPVFMIRKDQWKLFVYSQHPPYQSYTPQLFDVTADPSELHNVADSNTDIVKELTALLNTQLDVEAISMDVDEEGRGSVRRWMAAYPNEGWRPLFYSAYENATAEDEEKFEQWLNKEGPFKPN